MTDTRQPQKDQFTLALCSVLLLGTSLVFAAIGDAPQTLWFTAAGLGLSFTIRRPLKRTTRTYVYSGITVIALVVIQNQFFAIESERFVLLPAEVYCPTLIFIGMILTFFDQRESTIVAIVGTSLLGMMVAGNTFGAVNANSRFTAANLLLSELHIFYGVVALLQVSALLPLIMRALPRHHQHHGANRYRFRRTALVLTALFLVVSGGEGLRRVTFANADRMQFLFRRLMQHYSFSRMSHVLFPQNTDLWRTASPEIATDMTAVMHIQAALEPGYLRGRVYDFYENGQWTATTKGQMESLPVALPDGQLTAMRYYRPGQQRTASGPPALELFPTGRFIENILLAPGSASAVTIIADDVETDTNGTLTAHDWDTSGGYSIDIGSYDFASAYESPDLRDVASERYKHLPKSAQEELSEIAAGIFTLPDATTQKKLNQLTGFLRGNFSYSLGEKIHSDSDPVLQFLTETQRGHCELFATSAALLLRTQGIATRYVTGFVCTEKHPLGGHWIARLRDAHAWVEVFIPELGSWQLVEMTPSSGVPGGRPGMNWFAALFDQANLLWKTLLADVKRGHVAEAVISSVLIIGRFLWLSIADPLRGTIVALTLGIGTIVLILLRRHERHRHETKLPATIRHLRNGLRHLEKHVARYGVRRQPTQTVREFSQAIEQEDSVPGRGVLLDILKEYETLRYASEPPSRDVARSFCKRVRRGLKARVRQP